LIQDKNQTTRVYDAESACGIKQSWEKFTMKQAQAYVDKVLKRKYIREKYGIYSIRVLDGRGRRKAGATWRDGRVILLPKWARNEFVILHEIAHHLDKSGVSHGANFATIELDLVRNMMGKEWAEKLQGGFALRGVKIINNDGKAVKARCPKSQKEWLVNKKAFMQKYREVV